jgi:putative flippase GtrA
MFKQELLRRGLRFACVGGAVTLVFMGLNWAFAPSLGADWAFFVAYPFAVGLHFCLNKWWTFGDGRKIQSRQVSEYLVLMAVAFLIQTAVFKLVIHFTALAPWLASGVATVAQMALSFLAMQRRIFNGEPERAG